MSNAIEISNWPKFVFLFSLVWALASCRYWPPNSTGGYAQHYIFDPSYQIAGAKNCYFISFSQRLCRLNQGLFKLKNSRIVRCHPLRYAELKLLSAQIAQEIPEGLFTSAQFDMDLFAKNLDYLLDANHINSCPKVQSDMAWKQLRSRLE